MDAEPVIKVEHVSKNFVLPHEKVNTLKGIFTSWPKRMTKTVEAQHALRDINFEINQGEFFGIVGRNGSGKSTLLKILAGIYQPSSGSVSVHGRLVPFIELGVGFNGELTGRENVYLNGAMLGFSRKEIDDMYEDIVSFAELSRFMDQKLKNYSSGMQVRLAFSMATRAKADILLVDEVLAVGDAAFQRKCFDYFRSLKRAKKLVVFVSHDMGAIQQYCDRALLIEKSQVVSIDTAARIASMYNTMFTDEIKEKNNIPKAQRKVSPSGEKRWGDGRAIFNDVDVKLITEHDQEFVRIDAEIAFKEDIDAPIIGYSIKNDVFTQIVGTNTTRKNITLPPRRKGDVVHVTWKVPNVFNDGLHYVDCTVAHDLATAVSDRWPEAASFRAVRSDRNPYLVYISEDTDFTIKLRKGNHVKANS